MDRLETQVEEDEDEDEEDDDGEIKPLPTIMSMRETFHVQDDIRQLKKQWSRNLSNEPSENPEFSYLTSQSPAASADADYSLPSQTKSAVIADRPSTEVVLESTIVPSDDMHILWTRSSKANLSSRHFQVDVAMNDMDYKKTFIRKKIIYAREKSHQALALYNHSRGSSRTSRKYEYSVDMSQTLPTTQSTKMLLFKHNSKTHTIPDIPPAGPLENIQSGVEHYYDNGRLYRKVPSPNSKRLGFRDVKL